MSSNGTDGGTPRHTPSSNSDAEESTIRDDQEPKTIALQPSILQQSPESLSLLAESQRLRREMIQLEMGETLEPTPAMTALALSSTRSEVPPVGPTILTSLPSPTRTRVQLLEAELTDNKRRMTILQESNQRHQKLVQTLQVQLTQSKRKITDLEMEIEDLKLELQKNEKKLQSKEMEHDSRLEARENVAKMREESLIAELENLTSALEAERAKSAELSRSNEVLQDQLEEAASANQGLSRDVAQLTQAWRSATQALEKKDAEWQAEENAFNEYFAAEHNRLLVLWREVVALRRAFAELRHQSARDFTQMNSEIMRMGQSLVSSCGVLANNLRAAELESADSIARSRRALLAEEENAKARNQSLSEALARSQGRLVEVEANAHQLNRRVQDLLSEISDKDRVLNTLKRLRATFYMPRRLETEQHKEGAEEDREDPVAITKCLIEQTHAMHQALSQIAQTVLSDTASADVDEAQEPFLVSFQHQMQTGEWAVEEGDGDGGVLATPRERRPRSTSPIHRASPLAPSALISPISPIPRSVSTSTPPTKLAGTALSAVQSALNRRAMQVQALRLKLSSLRGRLDGSTKRFKESEEERSRLVEHTNALRSDLETLRKQIDAARLERDKTKHALSLALEERTLVERARTTATEQVGQLQSEVERFRRLLHDACKERDNHVEKSNALQLQYESEARESSRLQRLLEQSEVRGAQFRAEAEAARVEAEKKEQQQSIMATEMTDITAKFNRAERRCTELGELIEKSHQEKQKLQDKLTSLEGMLEARDQERSELAHQLSLISANEMRLVEERNALRVESQHLHSELSRFDAEVQSSSAEMERLRSALARLEAQRAQAESETLRFNREKAELTEEITATNQRICVAEEEIETLRREVSQQVATISRLNEEREEIIQDKDDLAFRLSLADRERHQLSDLVSKLRTDREVLDNEAFLAQRQITELKNKVEKQETDIANLNLRRNTLQAEVQRLRSDFEAELGKIQRQRDRLGVKYAAEVEELRATLATAERRLAEAEEAAVQAVLRADRAAAEAAKASMRETDRHGISERESQRWAEEQARLNHELILAQRERDDALMRAEQERQKVLALAAEDHATVRERLVLLQETIADLEKTLDRTRREADLRAEKDEATLKVTKDELRTCREQLEEFKASHEKEVLGLREQMKTLEANLDRTVHEYNETQLQLRLCEESRYSHRSEFSQITKLLREAEESRNSLRREVVDQRKQLTELESVKCTLEATVQEKRRQIRDLETQRTDQSRALEDMREQLELCQREFHGQHFQLHDPDAGIILKERNARHSPRSTVKSHDDLLISDLRQKLAECEVANSCLQQNCAELRTNLGEEIANLEEVKRECTALKRRLAESEATSRGMEGELASLQRRYADAEERLRARQWSTGLNSEEAHRDCKRLEESKLVLQSRLEKSEQTNHRLSAELSSASRRLAAAETESRVATEGRNEAEARLSAIHSLLRRLLGFRQRQGASPTLMLLSKPRRFSTSLAGLEDTESGNGLDGLPDGDDNIQHGRRSRSISPMKQHDNSYSRSHSAERKGYLLQGWSEGFGESSGGGGVQRTATTGPTANSSSADSLGRSRRGMGHRRRSPSVTSDLDPEAVGFTLREVLRQLAQLEKERDNAIMNKRTSEEQLLDANVQLSERSDEVQQLRQIIHSLEEENKTLSDQVRKSQVDLMNQESELRRMAKERDMAIVRVEELQRRLQLMEEECKAIQDKLNASKALEAKAAEEHRRELRKSLEDAEAHLASAESARRALESDLHRQKAINSDKSAEIKSLKNRLDSMTTTLSELEARAVEAAATVERLTAQSDAATRAESEARGREQICADRCVDLEAQNAQLQERINAVQRLLTTAEHEHRLLQERLNNTQKSSNDCKEKLDQLNTRVQKLQSQLNDADLVRCELETQNRQLTRELGELEALKKDLTQQVVNFKHEKESVQMKLDNLLKNKLEWEKSKREVEFENKDLKEKLKELHLEFEHMVRERLREKELNSVLVSSQEDIRKRTHKLEEENLDYRRQIQRLNAQLSLREESYASRLDELLRNRQAEMEAELEKKSTALQQCQKGLESKELSHRQRVKSLEDQIRVLNEQLSHEASRRQLYMSTSRLPIASSSTGNFPSLGYTVAHSQDRLALLPVCNRTTGVNSALPPRLPQTQSSSVTTTAVETSQQRTTELMATGERELSVSAPPTESSRASANISGVQTPSMTRFT